ncbi:hypothetical protein [Streptomyces sp. NPDC059874]|uniref:hypothetical protein n=1 Tax=Streptomyces sp. NPDC059874 TaxID=3346983 RepID=UPI00366150E2
MNDDAPRGNIVLVHGGVVDGTGWQGVHDSLLADGHNVAVVQHPTTSLDSDVAITHRVIEAMPGPVTLVCTSPRSPRTRASR